ncbi:hypothetical protein E0I26_06330 [Flavobacterium rhamnosiphilum]|uniref:Lipoprotein n=1 Tax=Flavobacterium rhamnosiphilum TaxID=2541724 RepID=A0A4R5FA19_9FLAO|nr:hypothetical protein [Flavobacterium rhamnosiphilum]TDE45560.1 hypothetical protein E0I26_06330 [Flavobacterium rhamnosiphilum]
MKKMLLLSLLGIGLCLSVCSFTTFKEIAFVKDGNYKAFISKKTKTDGRGFSGANGFEENVIVTIENNHVKQISPVRFNKNTDKLLDLILIMDNKGNAEAETSSFEQNTHNKNDQGWYYTYKLKIYKKDLEQ